MGQSGAVHTALDGPIIGGWHGLEPHYEDTGCCDIGIFMIDERVLVPVDFEDLDDWLHSVGSSFSAAELHGALVGGLAGSMRLSMADWSAFGLAVMGADERLMEDDKSRKVLGYLVQEQLDLLAGEDLRFTPFLPEDNTAIADRVEAMSLWCKGFLGGFAEAQVFQSRGDQGEAEAGIDQLPPNVAEALQDMSAIAQASLDVTGPDGTALDSAGIGLDVDDADVDDGLSGPEPHDAEYGDEGISVDEYNERDFFELVEYLRFAALTVFTEYGWVEVQDTGQANKVRAALKNAIEMENPAYGRNPGRTLH